MQDIHDKADDKNDENKHVCLEPGCGKAFRYASKLQKHENSHGEYRFISLKLINVYAF